MQERKRQRATNILEREKERERERERERKREREGGRERERGRKKERERERECERNRRANARPWNQDFETACKARFIQVPRDAVLLLQLQVLARIHRPPEDRHFLALRGFWVCKIRVPLTWELTSELTDNCEERSKVLLRHDARVISELERSRAQSDAANPIPCSGTSPVFKQSRGIRLQVCSCSDRSPLKPSGMILPRRPQAFCVLALDPVVSLASLLTLHAGFSRSVVCTTWGTFGDLGVLRRRFRRNALSFPVIGDAPLGPPRGWGGNKASQHNLLRVMLVPFFKGLSFNLHLTCLCLSGPSNGTPLVFATGHEDWPDPLVRPGSC